MGLRLLRGFERVVWLALVCALLVTAAALPGHRFPLGAGVASAASDPYEPNDNLGQAYGPLDRGDYQAYIQTGLDRDFFYIEVPVLCKVLRVDLTGIPESCDYGLRVYDASGKVIGESQSGGNADERVALPDLGKGRYYIEVWPHAGYSGTDDYALGIRRSDLVIDRVWEKVGPSGMSPPLSGYDVAQVEAADASTAYAVLDPPSGQNGKVLKTTDYGDSWAVFTLVHPNPDIRFGWTRNISVVNDQVVWVGSVATEGYGMARTTDGGGAWAFSLASAYMHALEATSDLYAWAASHLTGVGIIERTYNGGHHWELEFAHSYYSILDIHHNGGDAWAVGAHRYDSRVLRRVTNPTVGWAEVALPEGLPQALEGIWNAGGGVVWAVGFDKVVKTTDYGDTWSVYATPPGAGRLKAVCALDASTAFVAGDHGTILRTTDGGENWDFMWLPTDEHLTSICVVDAGHAWASGEKGTLLRMVDANTRAGSGVTVDLGGGDNVTFSSVTAAGITVKVPRPNPTGEEFQHHLPFRGCVDISTSASYEGSIEVRMPFNPEHVTSEEAVRMFKKTGEGSWANITDHIDTENSVAVGETSSLSEVALIYPFPKINAVTPSWGIRGNAVDVEIAGYGFWESSTAKPYVALQKSGQADIAATDVVVRSLYRITCRFPLPAGAPVGKWNLYIRNPDDAEDTLSQAFRVMDPMPAPTVTSTSPGFAQRGTQDVRVDINGTGFWEAFPALPTAWLSRAGQADIAGTLHTFYGATKIRFEFDLPADAYSGPWDVNLRSPDGKVGTLPGGFMITGALPPPTLTGVNPNSGALGATVDVTLSGTGFWGAPSVALRHANESQGGVYNPIWATNVAVQSSTSITCRFTLYANRQPGSWNVFMRSQDNREAVLAGGFTITGANPPPTVTSITPNTGAQGSNVAVTDLAGTGFFGTPTVKLKRAGQADITATGVTAQSPTKITCTLPIPAGAATGAWDVAVKNPDNREAVLAGGFTITGANPPPTVTSITPNTGAQGSNVAVTDLAGTGFFGTPTVKLKRAGQADITATGVTAQSPTKITCTLPIPAGAATGAWDVAVKNPDNREAVLAGGFTVTPSGGGNTPPGSDVEVDLGGGIETTFSGVSGGGNTTATQQPDPEVANFHILGGSCYDITTTATFTGTILVTLPYDEASLPVPESSLRMLHKEGGEWVDVTRSVDTDANRVTGEVDSLSPFALGWKAANVWYLAEGCTEGGMETWVLVQNPNDDPVRVNLTFMTSRGKVDGPQGFEIAGKSRHSFNLNELVKDWNVSTKVESREGDVICERAMYGNGRAWAHVSVGYEP